MNEELPISANKAAPNQAKISAIPVTQPQMSFWFRHRNTITGYLFLTPFLLAYITFLIYPLFRGLLISTYNWDLLVGPIEYVGLENYVRMLTNDPRFWSSTWHTIQFVALSVPLIIVMGLLQALALNRKGPAMPIFRTIFFSSYVLAISVVTLIWAIMFNPNRGILAAFLEAIGLEPIAWLTSPIWAMPAIVITTIWWTAGFNTIIFLAGLQDIPSDLYEAAEIDGAGQLAMFRSITLPLLRRPLLFVTILQVIASFQIFGQVFLMTRGGPANSTRVLVQHIYETGFRGLQLGYASSMATFLFVVMLIISIVQLIISNRKED